MHGTLVRLFQNHGGYMLNYPLLTPHNTLFDDFKKSFRLTDPYGLILCLPYNHRIPLARYLVRSGCTDTKIYQIGKVFAEKLKSNSLHPREHTEASFDIVTSNNNELVSTAPSPNLTYSQVV